MKLKILSPIKEIFKGEVKDVYVPTINGEYGIYPDHSPMILNLSLGELSFTDNNNKKNIMAISEGMLRTSLNETIINVISGVFLHEIDIEKIEKEKEKLEEQLKTLENIKETRRIKSHIKLYSLHLSTYHKHRKSI